MSKRRKRRSSSSRNAWPKREPSASAARARANLSDVNSKQAAAVALWAVPDMESAPTQQRMATVGGLADLQAEAHKEAFDQGLAEGREAGRAEEGAQVEGLARTNIVATEGIESLT